MLWVTLGKVAGLSASLFYNLKNENETTKFAKLPEKTGDSEEAHAWHSVNMWPFYD